MSAYYNEFDPRAAAWLRELIKQGHIADGVVDERDIRNVQAAELVEFTQCHFFAGIGGWGLALRRAGWPDDSPVWTGSCPCQPFSAAGKRKGTSDERHLWPDFFRLVRECRPVAIFGEQVASGDGYAWLDAVHSDLEGEGYACGAVDLPACGVGAPHIRNRLWFVAHALPAGWTEGRTESGSSCSGFLGDTGGNRSRGDSRSLPGAETESDQGRSISRGVADELELAGAARGFWSDAEWIPCRDGKWRPVESGSFPLAHGISGRVGLLRGYGNAINVEAAAAVIRAALDATGRTEDKR